MEGKQDNFEDSIEKDVRQQLQEASHFGHKRVDRIEVQDDRDREFVRSSVKIYAHLPMIADNILDDRFKMSSCGQTKFGALTATFKFDGNDI